MEQPRPMLHSQRFTPSPAYGYEQTSRRSRQPLRDTTGNAQHFGGLVSSASTSSLPTVASQSSCRQAPSLGLFSPSLPPSIPTPVVPSQAGAIYRGGMGGMRSRSDHLGFTRRSRHDINPIYFAPEFRPYRDKQDQKDPNEKQIWPRVLEDAFLDSLLIIPHMGRKKYSMQGKQFGRNMLISEYLWIAYCTSLQGQQAEERKRKQVSSHIQVVKKMFEKHRCYHFFFVKDADKSEARLKDNSSEVASFKDNPVLIALSEGRLPDVRPNYEYFSQILAMDSMVVMRPKTCWIFVSSSDVTMDEASGNAYDRSGKALEAEAYPHLEKNLQKESDGGLARGLGGNGVLLHEYNRELVQKESSAATELVQDWETRFPVLHRSLEAATSENRWLDMLEMNVTLELHPRSNFPGGSELNGFMELSIAQPQLQNHRWKCVTRLQRPEELCRAGEESTLVEQTSEVGVQYMHRPGCGGSDKARPGLECDCRTRPRQDVRVPFPAAEWASILSNCASCLQEPLDPKSKGEGVSSEDIKASEQAALESERTAAELIQQIAMFQELWSSPPDGAPADRRKWTRRGVIVWKFRTVHAFDDKWNPIFEKAPATKGRKPSEGEGEGGSSSGRRGGSRSKRVYHPPGTTWRFLTALDPISPDHQQNVCVNPATNTVPSRDMIMAPNPHYSHHFTAAMSENLHAAWDPSVSMASQLPSMAPAGPLGMVDNGFHGLATPPPTASIHSSSYAPSFDGSQDNNGGQPQQPPPQQQHPHQQPHHPHPHQQPQLEFIGPGCTTSMENQSTLVTDASGADPFLSATAGMDVSANINPVGYDETDFSGGAHGAAGPPAWDPASAASFGGLEQWNGWDGGAAAAAEAAAKPPSHAQAQHWAQQNQRSVAANSNLWVGAAEDDEAKDEHGQIWGQQSWTQAMSAAAAVTGADARPAGHHHQHHPQQHHPQQQQHRQQPQHPQHQRVLPSLDQISPLKGGLAGRKRARSNSLDMENRENFPATAIQKLVHNPQQGGMIPGEGGHAPQQQQQQPRWE